MKSLLLILLTLVLMGAGCTEIKIYPVEQVNKKVTTWCEERRGAWTEKDGVLVCVLPEKPLAEFLNSTGQSIYVQGCEILIENNEAGYRVDCKFTTNTQK
jgi:hypothetical protein